MNGNWLAVDAPAKERDDQVLREVEHERFLRQVQASPGSQRVNLADVLLVIGGMVLLLLAG